MSTNTTSRTAMQVSTESGDTQSGAADASDAGANDTGSDTTGSQDSGTRLADTGSVNTTPYVVGGTLFLGLGAGFVTYSVRRERTAAF
jgi:LPXTG-motif cell wall-anchored protein